MQSRLSKNPNLLYLLWLGKNLKVYTAQDQHFTIQILKLWMNWENLCPNSIFTVENKMGNSHRKGWSHFKLNINDWDLSFPKILRTYQWIGKKIFHWGKWNEPLANSVHTTNYLVKRLWRCLFLADVYKLVNVSEWTLETKVHVSVVTCVHH